jgi:hypothetical protein
VSVPIMGRIERPTEQADFAGAQRLHPGAIQYTPRSFGAAHTSDLR